MLTNHKEFQNKTILVVGASSGIGSAVTKELLMFEGINLVLLARNTSSLLSLKNNYENVCIEECDLSSIESIINVCALLNNKVQKFDGFVYCAGVSPLMKVVDTDFEVLHNTYEVNIIAFIELMKWFMTEEASNKGASVVVMSSVAATISSYRQTVYASTKAALEEAVRCMAKEGVDRKIRVNALSAGAVDTPMLEKLFLESSTLKDKLNKKYPFGVIPTEIIAKNIIHLLSSDSDYTTGSVLNIDSGFLIYK